MQSSLPVQPACGDRTYGGLAQVYMPDFYAFMRGSIAHLGKKSRPDEVKPIRHSIGDLRNLVDIFVFSFPETSPTGDAWRKLRADLDEGHSRIGAFQDLIRAEWTKKDEKKLRNKLLEWQGGFEGRAQKRGYNDFVRSARADQLFYRPESVLAKAFWKEAGSVPALDLSGRENMARLENGLALKLAVDYPKVTKLKSVCDTEKHHMTFHNFRKLFRSARNLQLYFPDLYDYNVACDVPRSAAGVEAAYKRLGKLHDLYITYDYKVQHGHKKEAQAAAKEVSREWKATREWLESEKVLEMLACIAKATSPAAAARPSP